ncbi:MAG: transposase [Thermoplasmatota archaeon]
MVVASGTGVPIGLLAAPANPHESTLAEATLRSVRVPRKGRGRPRTTPHRLIGDKAYDSKSLRAPLRKRGTELIAPQRENASEKIQDGRPLRRYKRRWIIERTNSWLNTACRRLTTRWERSLTAFTGFLHVAIIMICLRRL